MDELLGALGEWGETTSGMLLVAVNHCSNGYCNHINHQIQWIGRIGRARASQFAALDLGAFAIFGSDSHRYLSLNNGKASASRTSDVPEPVPQEQNISRQVKGSEKDR